MSGPPFVLMLPFAALLLAIAFAPVVMRHHWERHYHKLCVGLAAIVCAYYLLLPGGLTSVAHAAGDYLSFVVVVGSFYVVASNIHIRTRGAGRPVANTLFLLVGAIAANVIGTVGASMLLIRPWISMNRNRFAPMHLAFFIFIVSNVGGALLPVGPPLFLGYLKGVPFWWVLQRCWVYWIISVAFLLAVFYCADATALRRSRLQLGAGPANPDNWHCDGAKNFVFLALLLGALIAVPPVWREVLMLAAAVVAFMQTPARIREANAFSFAPIKEVAWLFLGIFGTMIPVLDYMKLHAAQLGLTSDAQFFWATGILSALLDNAPTYLTFLAAALGIFHLDINSTADVAQFTRTHGAHLVAISLGATFFGALTYIGNGPNLLVKSIAEHAGMRTPTFFGYVFKWALPVLLPLFVLLSLLFF